jgi:hypothetical protein
VEVNVQRSNVEESLGEHCEFSFGRSKGRLAEIAQNQTTSNQI